jgi:hypothetical protein
MMRLRYAYKQFFVYIHRLLQILMYCTVYCTVYSTFVPDCCDKFGLENMLLHDHQLLLDNNTIKIDQNNALETCLKSVLPTFFFTTKPPPLTHIHTV